MKKIFFLNLTQKKIFFSVFTKEHKNEKLSVQRLHKTTTRIISSSFFSKGTIMYQHEKNLRKIFFLFSNKLKMYIKIQKHNIKTKTKRKEKRRIYKKKKIFLYINKKIFFNIIIFFF